MAQRLQTRRDTAANWLSINPVLLDGEPGLETDTRQLKFGDGVTPWTSLPYSIAGSVSYGTTAGTAAAGNDSRITGALQAATAAATYAPLWKANTAYSAGQAVVLPTGVTGTATVSFTSGSTFDASKWTVPANPASNLGTRAQTVASSRVLADGEPALSRDGGVSRLLLGDGTTTVGNLPWTAWGPPGWVAPEDPRFGAKADARPGYQAQMTVGSATLYTPGRNGFSALDVGAVVVVPGAGAAGAPLASTVAAYVSPNTVTLAASAQTAVTGATFNIGHDDAPAINAAITAAGRGGTVYLGNKYYLIASTIVTTNPIRILGGGSNYGTVLLPGTPGMTMFLITSATIMEDLCVSGSNYAGWGIKTTAQANKTHLQRVRVEYCDAGFVYEATQNAVNIDLFAQYNTIGYYLVNGVANCKWVNCNAAGDAVAPIRHIVVDNITDSRVNGTVYAGGNRAASFFGGIIERNGTAYGVEILAATNLISFTEVELSGGGGMAAVHVGPNANIPVHFNRSTFVLDGSNLGVVAEAGKIRFDNVSGSGWSGRSPQALVSISGSASFTRATDSNDTFTNMLAPRDSNFRYGPGGWSATGSGGAISWDSTGRLSVTSTGSASGARTFFEGSGIVAAGRLARVTFYISDITGATDVSVRWATNSGNKAMNVAGNYTAGEKTVIVNLDGDETGILFGAGSSVASTFKIAYVFVNII